MKRCKVYVAGPYSDTNVLGVLRNIGRGQDWASHLFMLGFAPFTPWHDKEFVIQNYDEHFEVSDFYEYSMEWLMVSDAVFVVPNLVGLKNWQDSGGTLKELETAEEHGIPIFYELDKLEEYARGKGFEV
jgi:hypothetical protein